MKLEIYNSIKQANKLITYNKIGYTQNYVISNRICVYENYSLYMLLCSPLMIIIIIIWSPILILTFEYNIYNLVY